MAALEHIEHGEPFDIDDGGHEPGRPDGVAFNIAVSSGPIIRTGQDPRCPTHTTVIG